MNKLNIFSLLTLMVFTSSCIAGLIGVGGVVGSVAIYKRGALISHEGAPYKKCLEAVLKSMEELNYKVESVERSDLWNQETVKARTIEGTQIKITLKWKAKDHTEIKVKVGRLGDENHSNHILEHIRWYIYQ